VANLLEKLQPGARGAAREQKVNPRAPLPREITSDPFLAYSDVDAGYVSDLADFLNSPLLLGEFLLDFLHELLIAERMAERTLPAVLTWFTCFVS
jgi:hypothetical protein